MISSKTEIRNTPLTLTIDDRKLNLSIANISIEQTATGSKLIITGNPGDRNQVVDLASYLQQIPNGQ